MAIGPWKRPGISNTPVPAPVVTAPPPAPVATAPAYVPESPTPLALPQGATGTFNPNQAPKGAWMSPGTMIGTGRTTNYDPGTGLPSGSSTAGDVNPANPVVGNFNDAPVPIDYDALIAQDPEYQFLLQKLQAAMGNMEAEGLAEQSTIQAQTQRRMQQLREQGQDQLVRSNNDFSGRGLGFSGGFLEDQGSIRRQVATGEADTEADKNARMTAVINQLTKARAQTEEDKRGAFIQTGSRLRGERGGSLSQTPIDPYAGRRLNATSQAAAPSVISPAAVARRATGTATAGMLSPAEQEALRRKKAGVSGY